MKLKTLQEVRYTGARSPDRFMRFLEVLDEEPEGIVYIPKEQYVIMLSSLNQHERFIEEVYFYRDPNSGMVVVDFFQTKGVMISKERFFKDVEVFEKKKVF